MKNKNEYRIYSSNGIDEKLFVPINGQNQYIFIRGKDINNPVILGLHGGPANPDAFLTYKFVKEITDSFTFVSWDQRGCGRTYFENKKIDSENETATFEQALKDVDEVVNYLCRRFHKDKVIIMGHSYGTLLGVSYIYAYPQKVEKYIGVGNSVSIMDTQTENYKEIISSLKPQDKRIHKFTETYSRLNNDFNIEKLMIFQRMTIPYFLAEFSDIKQENQLKLIISSPDVSLRDIRWLLGMSKIKKHYARNKKLLDYAFSTKIYDVGTSFFVPMFFISGEYDRSCHVSLVREYYETITAPSKKLVIMKKCGHSPQLDEPVLFAEELKKLLQEI